MKEPQTTVLLVMSISFVDATSVCTLVVSFRQPVIPTHPSVYSPH